LKGSLCHRYPACASFPPAGPALWARACRREPRDPGLPFRLSPGNFRSSRASENKKPSGAAGSGGSTSSGWSIPLTRDRSHEPGVRHRLAASHSTVGRAFRIRVASQGSCWFANPMFARARDIRQRLANVNSKSGSKLQQAVIIRYSRRHRSTSSLSRLAASRGSSGEGGPLACEPRPVPGGRR